MTDTYHGVPYPSNWANMDLQRRQAWKMGAIAAVSHLGLSEARTLAAELEATNGASVRPHVAPEERQEAQRNVYAALRGTPLRASQLDNTGLRADIAMALAGQIVTTLIAQGWGDLSGATIEITQLKMQQRSDRADCEQLHERYRDTIAECNAALKRVTGGR
ncbi:MAG TPA: hypothetical protein VGH72_33570 [Pseudonocardia sp.]|jgi:hypothetical protein